MACLSLHSRGFQRKTEQLEAPYDSQYEKFSNLVSSGMEEQNIISKLLKLDSN
jgi:hypothetical protein